MSPRRGSTRLTRIAGLAVATLVATAGLVGVAGAPASAALCSTSSGVNVVVDFQGLGGGVQKGCDPNGANRDASSVFPAAGFSLKYAQRAAGFVCRVQGKPSSDPCVNASPADAYWGLYWSDGKSGTWNYSSSGVGGLQVPAGGFVAFSWQNGGANDPPGTSPVGVTPAPTPTPTPKATAKPKPAGPKVTTKPTKAAQSTAAASPTTSASASASASTLASAAAAARASASAASESTSESASASAVPTEATQSPSADAAQPVDASPVSSPTDDGGLPLWVPVGVLLVLGALTGGVLLRRRAGARGQGHGEV